VHAKAWCSPTIWCDKRKGPVVLSCNWHDKSTCGSFLHVPTNPTRVVMSKATNQHAPAVVLPKTMWKAQACEFSNSFQMNEMAGFCDGIDSVTLADCR